MSEVWTVGRVRDGLKLFLAAEAEFRRKNTDGNASYGGPGLRPLNAVWLLVRHCGLGFDEACRVVSHAQTKGA